MIEQTVDIKTRDGLCTTFIVHPERDGPYPVVLFYMDAGGYREELRDMARRLASAGYYVMLPNLFYRSGVVDLGPVETDPKSAWFQQVQVYVHALSVEGLMADTDAWLSYVDTQPAAKQGPVGCVGYCLSGQYVLAAAGRHPDRIAAAAAFFSVYLMTNKPDSPHLAARSAKGEISLAGAEDDPFAPAETMRAVGDGLKAHGVNASVEIYPGTRHGFAFPHRYSYDKTGAERHWERLHALFRRRLG